MDMRSEAIDGWIKGGRAEVGQKGGFLADMKESPIGDEGWGGISILGGCQPLPSGSDSRPCRGRRLDSEVRCLPRPGIFSSAMAPGGLQLPKGHSGNLLSYDPEHTELNVLLKAAQAGGGEWSGEFLSAVLWSPVPDT